MRPDTPLPLYATIHVLDEPPPVLELRTYLMDSLFLNQKTNSNIRISHSLKYKHSKKEYILYEKKNQKTNSTKSVMIHSGANFPKKVSPA